MGLAQLKGSDYILDGHFTLFDKDFNVTKVSDEVFKKIDSVHICIVIDDPIEVAKRLFKRDGIFYDSEKLNQMQMMELEHAKHLSNTLKTPLAIIKNGDIAELLEKIYRVYQKRIVRE